SVFLCNNLPGREWWAWERERMSWVFDPKCAIRLHRTRLYSTRGITTRCWIIAKIILCIYSTSEYPSWKWEFAPKGQPFVRLVSAKSGNALYNRACDYA